MDISGSITALATPFSHGVARLDERGFQDFLEWQIHEGTHGVVVCGTTGETPTLSHQERDRLIRLTVELAGGRVPVLAGVGSNSTNESIAAADVAKAAGADALLVVTPYYNRPSQEGLYRHFEAIAGAVDLPIVLYNVPSRTGVDLSPHTVARLSRVEGIIGIKDATGDLARPSLTASLAGDTFLQLSGNDVTALAFNQAGGQGCISVASNAAPRLCSDMQAFCLKGDHGRAEVLGKTLRPLIDALSLETNPVSIKCALSMLRPGFAADVRLPLVAASPATRIAVRDALEGLGLFSVPSVSGRIAWSAARMA